MTTLQKAIKDRLASDFLLTTVQPAGLGFTVWDRWLVKPANFAKPEAGSTPEAFNAASGGRMKRNIVVREGADVPHPGDQPGDDAWRWDNFCNIYIFAEAHENGKQAAKDAELRVRKLLKNSWEAVITGGQRANFRPAGGIPLDDSELWPGNVVLVARFRATGSDNQTA